MLWSRLTVINWIQIFIVSPLIVISFLNLTWRIPYTSKIVYSQGLRIKRLCSSSLAFEKHLMSIRYSLGNRGCLKNLVDNQLRMVVENKPEQLSEHQANHGTDVPLVVTYDPRFHDLGRIIRKNFIFLYAEEQAKQLFEPAPFVSFRLGFSLRNHLVRAKVYPFLKEKGSSW